MRDTRKRRHLPLHLESFEARQLLSASVAQSYAPLAANSSPATTVFVQTDTGTTIQAATNQSFGGYLGTFHTLIIPGAPTGAFWISNSILHIVNPAIPDTTDQTLDSYNVNIDWGDGATVTHDAYLVPNPNGGYDLYASHVFSAAGSYQISVSVQTTAIPNPQFTGSNPATATISTSGSFTSTAQVADNNPNAPKLLQLNAPNDTFSAKLSNFFGNDTTNILWGDGAAQGGYSPDGYTDPTAVDASHTYQTPGVYTLSALDHNSNTIFFAQINATASNSTTPSTPTLIFPLQAVALQHFAGYLGTINSLTLPGQPDLITGGTTVDTVTHGKTTNSTTLHLSVNWGDGSHEYSVYLVSNGKGGYNVYGYHVYGTAGDYTVSVTLNGSPTPNPAKKGTFLPGPGAFSVGLSAAMQVAATGLSSLPQLSAPNGIFNGKIASSSGNGTTSVSWGDGATSTPTLVINSPYSTGVIHPPTGTLVPSNLRSFDVFGSHKFLSSGTHLLTFFSAQSHTVYFADVTTTGRFSPAPVGAPNIQSDLASYSSITDPVKTLHLTTNQKFSDLTSISLGGASLYQNQIYINWGDGTHTIGTGVRQKDGTYAVQAGTHAYKNAGRYTIVITWGDVLTPKKGQPSPLFINLDSIHLLAIVTAPPKPTPASTLARR